MPAMARPRAVARRSHEDRPGHDISISVALLSSQPPEPLQCCCGRMECLYLKHNCTVLESVENDVRIAAKLGQSLLERHEAYLADAERDRAQLINRIGQLEMDKKELEAENARKIEENRALLDQLETLNNNVADSDTRVKLLEATLQSSQQIIRRLEGAADRAEDMERHLAALEAEQAILQSTLAASESEARSAIARWRRAERGIADLQDQLERMEKETTQEKERHMEIMGRVERQRAVERELSTAAGRLKGAAAARSLQDNSNNKAGGSGVVTHFVRDLLQDNANLQLGMAELREMLMNSNDEIQQLRDQLMFHQPLIGGSGNGSCNGNSYGNGYGNDYGRGNGITSAASTLRAELETEILSDVPEPADFPGLPSSPRTPLPSRHISSLSQELHIHHHYHVGKKRAEPLRPKKKRLGLSPNVFTPPAPIATTQLSRMMGFYHESSSTSSPSRSSSRHIRRDSVSTSVSGPSNRWSAFSEQPSSDFTSSSVPSSPPANRRSSIFDRAGISDMSLPTSPATSIDPMSPSWRASGYRMSTLDDSLACGSSPPCRRSVPSGLLDQGLPAIQDDDDEDSHHQPGPYALTSGGNKAESSGTYNSSDFTEDVSDFASNASFRSESTAPVLLPHDTSLLDTVIVEEEDTNTSDAADLMSPIKLQSERRMRQRALSHESIVSLKGGLDIHTLKTRPSQLTLRPLGTYGSSMADTGISSVTARPILSRGCPDMSRSNAMLLDSLSSGLPLPRSRVVSSLHGSGNVGGGAAPLMGGTRRLSKLVGWRPWLGGGSSPAADSLSKATPTVAAEPTLATAKATATMTTTTLPVVPSVTGSQGAASIDGNDEEGNSNSNARTATSNGSFISVISSGSGSGTTKKKSEHKQKSSQGQSAKSLQDMLRAPGINQPGPVPGFFEYWATHQLRGVPSNVHPDGVDHEALRDGLGSLDSQ